MRQKIRKNYSSWALDGRLEAPQGAVLANFERRWAIFPNRAKGENQTTR